MSRIDDLIGLHCPSGVEYRALGEIGQLVRGNGMPKVDFAETGVGCIHYGQIYTYYGTSTTKTVSFIPAEKAAKLAKVDPGDLIVTNTSENVEDVCKAVAWLGDGQIVTGGHATVLKHDQDPKYLSYFLQTAQFHAEKKRHATGTKVIDVSASRLAKIRVPVPPIEAQREIVRVLDLFQSLEAELEAELEARSRQFAHYRDSLMDFGESVPRLPIGELGEIYRGRRFTKNDYVAEGLPAIHYGELYTEYGTSAAEAVTHVRLGLEPILRFAQPGDVVIAEVSETVEDVGKATAWLGDAKVAIHDGCYGFRHSMNPVFVAYYLQTATYHAEKSRHVARAKVKRLSLNGIKQVRIPVPEMAEQERIVVFLEAFDALIHDLSFGLPAELRARRKQYEYYRDRLLTFEEAA